MEQVENIVETAGKFVFDLFKEKLQQEFVYHNYNHTLETVEACELLAKGYELDETQREVLLLAAWFHDAGYTEAYRGHEDKSKDIAQAFLKERNYDQKIIDEVLICIEATKRMQSPANIPAEILCDADIINCGEKSFFSKSELLRAEWESFKIQYFNEEEWALTQLNYLLKVVFHTQEAQKIYGEQLLLNIQHQRKLLKKIIKKKNKKKKEKGQSKAQPKRGIETMFRSVYSSHINLSSIADSKANMMISINSLIISITLTLLGAKVSLLGTSFKQNQIVIYPIISLMLTSLISIIFGILSAKPKITKKITSVQELLDKKISVLFFGNFSHLKMEDFEIQIKEIMKNEDSLYGNMTRDIYSLGQVLYNKYRLLTYSYVSFLIGIIFTVAVTTFVVIYLKEKY
jgi:predicted metal-dependent HD superfamily phosphohydrolase